MDVEFSARRQNHALNLKDQKELTDLSEPIISPLPVRQNFDIELFKRLARVEELTEAEEELLKTRWYTFRESAKAYSIKNKQTGWFLAWLDEKAESIVDEDWRNSPARGYFSHVLAVSYLMSMAGAMIPEIAQTGCAPVPEPSEDVARAAGQLGLGFTSSQSMERRYSLLTPYPYAGGCSACFLKNDCPQKNQTLE